MERVWLRIKQTAQRYALENRMLPQLEAERIVEAICFEEVLEPVPPDAREFLTAELIALASSDPLHGNGELGANRLF